MNPSGRPGPPRGEKSRAVDPGCGEGRDAVFFAEHGPGTLVVDIAPNGLQEAIWIARESGVDLRVRRGDVNTLEIAGLFDLVYSISPIRYLSSEERFEHSIGSLLK